MHKRIVDTNKGLGFIIREVRSPKAKKEPVYHESPLPPEVRAAISARKSSQKQRIKDAILATKNDQKTQDAAKRAGETAARTAKVEGLTEIRIEEERSKASSAYIAQAVANAKLNIIETDEEWELAERAKYDAEVASAGAGFPIESQPEKSTTVGLDSLDVVRRNAMKDAELRLYKTGLAAELEPYLGEYNSETKSREILDQEAIEKVKQTFKANWTGGIGETDVAKEIAAKKMAAADNAEREWYTKASDEDKSEADRTRDERRIRDRNAAFRSLLVPAADAEYVDPQEKYAQMQGSTAAEKTQITNFIHELTILRDDAIAKVSSNSVDQKIAAANAAEGAWLDKKTDQQKDWANNTRESRIADERKRLTTNFQLIEYGPDNIIFKEPSEIIDILKSMLDTEISSHHAQMLFPLFFYDGREIADKKQVFEVQEAFKKLLLNNAVFINDQYTNQLLYSAEHGTIKNDIDSTNNAFNQANDIISISKRSETDLIDQNTIINKLGISREDTVDLLELMVNKGYMTYAFQITNNDDGTAKKLIDLSVAQGRLIKTDADQEIYDLNEKVADEIANYQRGKPVNIRIDMYSKLMPLLQTGKIIKRYRLQRTEVLKPEEFGKPRETLASETDKTQSDLQQLQIDWKRAVQTKNRTKDSDKIKKLDDFIKKTDDKIQSLKSSVPTNKVFWAEHADEVLLNWDIPIQDPKLTTKAARQARAAAAQSTEATIDSAFEYANTEVIDPADPRAATKAINDAKKAEKPSTSLTHDSIDSLYKTLWEGTKEKTPDLADLPSAEAQEQMQKFYESVNETVTIQPSTERGSVGNVMVEAGLTEGTGGIRISLTPYNILCKKVKDLDHISNITEKKNKFIELANGFLDFMEKFSSSHTTNIKQLKQIENQRMMVSNLLDMGSDLTHAAAANANISKASAQLVGLSNIYGSNITNMIDAKNEIGKLEESIGNLRSQIAGHQDVLNDSNKIIKDAKKGSKKNIKKDRSVVLEAVDEAENAKIQIEALTGEMSKLTGLLDNLKIIIKDHGQSIQQLTDIENSRSDTGDLDEDIQRRLVIELEKLDASIAVLPEHLKAILDTSEIFSSLPRRSINEKTGRIDPLLPDKIRQEILTVLDPSRAASRMKELQHLISTTDDNKERAKYEKEHQELQFREKGAAPEIGQLRAEIEELEETAAPDDRELWKKRRQLKALEAKSVGAKSLLMNQIGDLEKVKDEYTAELKQSSSAADREEKKAAIVKIDAKIKQFTKKLNDAVGADAGQMKKNLGAKKRIDTLKAELAKAREDLALSDKLTAQNNDQEEDPEDIEKLAKLKALHSRLMKLKYRHERQGTERRGGHSDAIARLFGKIKDVESSISELEGAYTGKTDDKTAKISEIESQLAAAQKEFDDSKLGIRSAAAIGGRGPVGEYLKALYLEYATPLPMMLLPIGPAYRKTVKIRVKGLISLIQLMHHALTSTDKDALDLVINAIGSASKYSDAGLRKKPIDGKSVTDIARADELLSHQVKTSNKLTRQHGKVAANAGRYAAGKGRANAPDKTAAELEDEYGEIAPFLSTANVTTIGELFNFLGAHKYRVVGSDARNTRKDQKLGYFQRLIAYQIEVRRNLIKVLDKRYGVGNWVKEFNNIVSKLGKPQLMLDPNLGQSKQSDKLAERGRDQPTIKTTGKKKYRDGQDRPIADLGGNEHIDTLEDMAERSLKNRIKLVEEQNTIGDIDQSGDLYKLWHSPPSQWPEWHKQDPERANKYRERRELIKSNPKSRSIDGDDIMNVNRDTDRDGKRLEDIEDDRDLPLRKSAYDTIVESPAEYPEWMTFDKLTAWLTEISQRYNHLAPKEWGPDWSEKVDTLNNQKEVILERLAELRDDYTSIQNEFISDLSGPQLKNLIDKHSKANESLHETIFKIENLDKTNAEHLEQLNSDREELFRRVNKIEEILKQNSVSVNHRIRLEHVQLLINKENFKLDPINKQLKGFKQGLPAVLNELSKKTPGKEPYFIKLAFRYKFAKLVVDTVKRLVNRRKTIKNKLTGGSDSATRTEMMETDIKYLLGDQSGIWKPFAKDEKGNNFSSSLASLKPQNLRTSGLMPTADGTSGFWGKVSEYDPNHRFISNEEIKRLSADKIVSTILVQFVQIISDITLYLRGHATLNINATGIRTNSKYKTAMRTMVSGGRKASDRTQYRFGDNELEGPVIRNAWKYMEDYFSNKEPVKQEAIKNLTNLGSQVLRATAVACQNAADTSEEDYKLIYKKQARAIPHDKMAECAAVFDQLADDIAIRENQAIAVAGTNDNQLLDFEYDLLRTVLDRLSDKRRSIENDIKIVKNSIKYNKDMGGEFADQKNELIHTMSAELAGIDNKIKAVSIAVDRKVPTKQRTTFESRIVKGALVIIDNVNDAQFLSGLRGYVSSINRKARTAVVELFNNNIVADKSVLLNYREMTPYL